MTPIANPALKYSLHRRIRTEIEDRIRLGAWRPGHRIPFEHELMAKYACVRNDRNGSQITRNGRLEFVQISRSKPLHALLKADIH